ncbi:DUF2786 domain-containing protein [Actinomadura alba]|uniref:DUF2786 domain-containing protein n=1 Tax=Actinomadura alba TaxID=406431 RepID=UPI0028AE49E6|nr:DUF2786 domain-containing protein [Actinomadura alba]
MDDSAGRRGSERTGGRWRHRRASGGPGRTAQAAADRLLSGALSARLRGDPAAFARCAAELSDRPGEPDWSRVVDHALAHRETLAVTAAWRLGWQPADVVRIVRRRHGARHARMATDMIAAEMRRYSAAAVDERWRAQLAALGARTWPGRGDAEPAERPARGGLDRPAAIATALDVLAVLATLPELPRLCPPPGEAGTGGAEAGVPARAVDDERTLARVRALLAKAESTEFPEEAEALSARAQQLMARHRIDDALLAAGARAGARGDEPAGRRVGVDDPYESPKTMLLDAVARANRCRVVWHRGLGFCTVLGFPADLDAVELLFTSLLVQATAAMVAAGPRRGDGGRPRTRSFRRSFLVAYAQRIGERLGEVTEAAEREAAAESPGTDLLPALAAREEAVDQAVGRMFPRLGRSAVTTAGDRDGWLHGRAAADLAQLHERDEVTGTGDAGR